MSQPGEVSQHNRLPLPSRAEKMLAWLAFLLFLTSLILSISLVKAAIGSVPIRSGLQVAAFGLLAISMPSRLIEGAMRVGRFLVIIFLFAALGSLISILNDVPTGAWFQQIAEIHIQATLGVILVSALIAVIGIAPIAWGFIGAVAISAVVAFGQALGLDAAWNSRAWTGAIMNDPPVTRHFYESRWRALGLSFTPVHIATQACLAFGALFALRLQASGPAILKRIDWWIIAGVAAAITLCIATGNRSPILGFLAFSLIYAALAAPRSLVLLAPLLALLAFGSVHLLEIMQALGMRVASVDDGSAEGRSTLMYFGIRLLVDHPIGYGLTFDSTQHWPRYTHEIIYMDNPLVIRTYALHNYLLVMLNKYGVAVLALFALCLPRRREQWVVVLAFIPYIAHIFFHNDGPFQADFLIWYVLPLFSALWTKAETPSSPRPWTRTYRAQRKAANTSKDICALQS
jgi:hypothetical protein